MSRQALSFRIYKGNQLLREETLTAHVIKIGKVQSAHLRIDDESVSRMHAILEVDPSGAVHVIDLGSTRGTFVNGHKVNKTRLESGDSLQLGDIRVDLTIGAPQEVPSPQSPVARPVVAPPPPPVMKVPAPVAALPAPVMAFGAMSDEDVPGAKAIEVAAMLGDSVVTVKHCMDPKSGTVTSRTWGMVAAGCASLLTSAVAFYVSVANAATNKAAQDYWTTKLKKPIDSFRPHNISLAYDALAFGGLALGITLLALALVRMRREKRSPYFRIGTAPGVELPLEQTPAPSFPLVAPSGDDFVFNYAPGMDGELIADGRSTPLAELVASGRARPSLATAGAIEIPIPMAAKIRARAGMTTFLVSAVPQPKEHRTPLLATLESRTVSYFAGSLAVHLGIWALLQMQPVEAGTAGIDMDNNATAETAFNDSAHDDTPPPEKDPQTGDTGGEDGQGTSMDLESGTSGTPDSPATLESHMRMKDNHVDPQLAMTQAREAARSAGILGDASLLNGDYFSSLTATGNVASGFDDNNAWGSEFGAEGQGQGSFGFGRNGFGRGGGCTEEPCGIIGAGKLGKIGNGHNFGEDWGGPGGRGGGLRRHDSAVPRPTIGEAHQSGDLDPAIIKRYVKHNIGKIGFCYEKELLARPGLAGEIQVQFFITPNGNVASAVGRGFDSTVANCVADVIHNIEFPKPNGGGGVQVNYPFTFRPSGS